MTTKNLTYTPPITASSTVLTGVPAAPGFLQDYGEHLCGTLTFTPQKGDIISCIGFASISIDQIYFNYYGERLSIFISTALKDLTTGQTVPGAVNLQQIWTMMNDVMYGTQAMQQTIQDRYSTMDFLIPGHTYEWVFAVRKEQTNGTPTMVVAVDDDSVSGFATNRAF